MKEWEIKGKEELGNREERRMGRIVMVMMVVMMVVMIVMGCNSGGVSEGKVDLAKKNSFLESLVKIGEGFQEIFGVFGSAVGDALGFNVVKVGDTRSKIGEHFEKVGAGLTTTKNKLKELEGKISEAKNADGVTIEAVKGTIKGANDVFTQLIASLTKLAGVTNDGSEIASAANAAASAPANKDNVETIIAGVKEIIKVAETSGVKIEKGIPGNAVASGAGTSTATINANAVAGAGAGPKLAEEVAKADPWAMIDKIKDSKTNTAQLTVNNNNDAGTLATGANANDVNGAKAATNADLAAAVALKAMIKGGKLSAHNANNEIDAVKAAATTAVNKVLGILDVIIRKTVSGNLDKVREAVKGIKYSENSGVDSTKSDTIQATTTK
ncbi:variable large family protein [Borrelia crocidurae]|uniref:Variable large protein n=1 Tax=Borrelia crocidurae (strain Achema) TaxID=1155096 RepID=I0FEL5_BORCA|nr:variable large family protein [Borrelia crocidurae]AFI31921.1 VmpS protein [Borrelia crocidurae str. Achema]